MNLWPLQLRKLNLGPEEFISANLTGELSSFWSHQNLDSNIDFLELLLDDPKVPNFIYLLIAELSWELEYSFKQVP